MQARTYMLTYANDLSRLKDVLIVYAEYQQQIKLINKILLRITFEQQTSFLIYNFFWTIRTIT